MVMQRRVIVIWINFFVLYSFHIYLHLVQLIVLEIVLEMLLEPRSGVLLCD
jgi:hypothetical protein